RGGTAIRQRDNTFSEIVGLHQGTGWMYMAADVTAAYADDADISMVQREVVYLAPNTVVIYDRVASTGNTTQTWGLVSPIQPQVSGATATFAGDHTMKVTRLAPSAASASVYDFKADSDYKNGWRLDATMAGGDQRYLHVLSIDGAATQTTAIGDTGVTMQLADGRNVTIEFSRNTPGASMTIDGTTTALTATVDTLPE
ncbi:MAG: hypothetical protein H0T79_19090, partial [Deltaproteobacteria bacterium]|nr:hypothetical protein [Deltaproteobacteria bacterium]